MVAHDVNPILAYLDRVVYLAAGGAVAGTPRRGDHHRDADPALRHPDRGAAHRPTAGWSWSASPRRPRITPTGTRPRRVMAARRDAAPRAPGTSSPTSGSCSRSTSWSTPSGPAPIVAVAGRRSSAGSWCCAGRPSPATPWRSSAFPARPARCWLGRQRQRTATSPSASRRALVIAALPAAPAGARLQRGVGGDRHRAGVRAGLRVPVRQPLQRLPQRRQRAAVRQLPRHHRRPGAGARWSSAVAALAVLAVDRPAAAVRLGRPRRRRRPRRAGPAAVGRSSWSCSGWRWPRSARSPARCWCSRCWSCPPRPPSSSPPDPALSLAADASLHRRWSSPGSASPSPTTRRTRSASTSPRFALRRLRRWPRLGAGRRRAGRRRPRRRHAPADAPQPLAGLGRHASPPVHAHAFLAGTAIAAGLPGWSATSWCCAARSSPATRSATSPSPARWRRWRVGHRPAARAVRRHRRWSALAHRRCSATAAGPTTSSSAASSPGSSASACCSSPSTPPRAAAATAPPASTCCSARSSGSTPAQARRRRGRSAAVVAWSCSRSPGRCCSPASTRRWPRARGVPVRLLGLGVPRPGRRHRRRGDPGRRRAAAARAAGRARPARRSG